MTLSTALNTAQAIFNNTSKQTAVVFDKHRQRTEPNYVRRSAALTTAETVRWYPRSSDLRITRCCVKPLPPIRFRQVSPHFWMA